jgi:hypothetical protein
MEPCVRCDGHPKHAHTLQPEHPMCQNCYAVKATKHDAKHYFKSKEEVKLQ